MSIQSRVEQKLRAAIMSYLGHRSGILFIPGNNEPKLNGRGYYWTTPGGKYIYYPNAYRWPKVYHSSTYTITCGQEWFDSKLKLPKGYRWGKDDLGICVIRNHDKETYHPELEDFLSGGQYIAKLLRESIPARKIHRHKEKVRQKYIETGIMVGTQDSIRSGNCKVGTLMFAKGLEKDNFDYTYVSAKRLSCLTTINKERIKQINRAIDCAIDRQTLVSI